MKREEMLMYPDEYRVMFEIEDRYWWYRGIRTLLTHWLERYAPQDRSRSMILDIGCGTGANLALMRPYGAAIGIDISEQALAFCRARGIPMNRLFLASAADLPFLNSQFDLAISFDVICNLADDVQAFSEVARVLKPGARFLVQMPAYQWLWSMHDVAVRHQRRYDAPALRKKLKAVGFEVERLTYANMLLMPLIAVVRMTTRRAKMNGRPVQSDLEALPDVFNGPLSALFTTEMRAASRVNLPYGLSVIAVARKR